MTTACPKVVELSEWQSTIIPDAMLTSGDRVLVRRFGERDDQRVGIDELRTGLRITTRSWVGVVHFESAEIRVIPKLVGGKRWLVDMIELTSGLSSLDAKYKLYDERRVDNSDIYQAFIGAI